MLHVYPASGAPASTRPPLLLELLELLDEEDEAEDPDALLDDKLDDEEELLDALLLCVEVDAADAIVDPLLDTPADPDVPVEEVDAPCAPEHAPSASPTTRMMPMRAENMLEPRHPNGDGLHPPPSRAPTPAPPTIALSS